jgi:hypothetical protein
MDIGSSGVIHGVATHPSKNPGYTTRRITQFKVASSLDGTTWTEVDFGTIFTGVPAGASTTFAASTYFQNPIESRYLRIIVQAFVDHPSLLAAAIMCPEVVYSNDQSYTLTGTNDNTVTSAMSTAITGNNKRFVQFQVQTTVASYQCLVSMGNSGSGLTWNLVQHDGNDGGHLGLMGNGNDYYPTDR